MLHSPVLLAHRLRDHQSRDSCDTTGTHKPDKPAGLQTPRVTTESKKVPRKDVAHCVIPRNSAAVTAQNKRTRNPRVARTCLHQSSETRQVTGRLGGAAGPAHAHASPSPSPATSLSRERGPAKPGYGTKIVYYKRHLTKMPNNLHYQCLAAAQLPLLIHAGRGGRGVAIPWLHQLWERRRNLGETPDGGLGAWCRG